MKPMQIYTVAHSQDQEDVELQRRSLKKFGSNYVHYVIWEDQYPGLPSNLHGWVRQQMIKLLIARDLNPVEHPVYMLLDAKNWLCRPCDFADWPEVEGNGMSSPFAEGDPEGTFNGYATWLAERLGFTRPEFCYDPVTPFLVNTHVAKNIALDPDFNSYFTEHELPSEFVLYNQHNPAQGEQHRMHHFTLWPDDGAMTPERLEEIKADPELFFFAVHRNYTDARSRALITLWLKELELII